MELVFWVILLRKREGKKIAKKKDPLKKINQGLKKVSTAYIRGNAFTVFLSS